MLEKIQIGKKEVLKSGAKKINNAIDATSEAQMNANQAVITADEAKTQAQSTQTQLDTIIIESGTSDAETLQARVGADGTSYTTVKERLDAENTEVYDRISDIVIFPEQFGAKGDWNGTTGTNDAPAIRSAIEHLNSVGGGELKFKSGKQYYSSENLQVPYNNITVSGHGAKLISGITSGTALKLGNDMGNTRRLGYRGLLIESETRLWTNETIGLEITSVVWSTLSDIEVEGFQRGLVMNSVIGGCAYNEISIRRLYDNKINLHIDPHLPTSWVNENSFYGGNFSIASSRPSEEGIINLKIDHGAGSVVNNNRFYSPCFEGAQAKAIVCNALYNSFYSPRFENSVLIEFGADSGSNVMFHGRGLNPANVTDNGNYNQIFSRYGMSISGGTTDANSGVIDVRNRSSASYPTIISRNPLKEIRFSVDGNGNVNSLGEIKGTKLMINTSGVRGILYGVGSPEGVVTASPGCLYLNGSGGAGTTLYVKESGAGNTGWVGK